MPRDRSQPVPSMQPSKKLIRANVVKIKPSLSKKKAYNKREKSTRAIFGQFISGISRTVSSELRTASAKTISDKMIRTSPDQKKIKPAPGSATLPRPSRDAP